GGLVDRSISNSAIFDFLLNFSFISCITITTHTVAHMAQYIDASTQTVPSLAIHREFINERFRTTLQSHCMKPGWKSKIHPLQTSGINEGKTRGQINVIDDLGLQQLKLTAAELEKLLLILGGDQSTVEKIRT